MNKRIVQLILIRPTAAALGFALLFGLIYPSAWPEQAKRPDDPVGYWIGSIGIPAVAILVMALGARRYRREVAGDQDPGSNANEG